MSDLSEDELKDFAALAYDALQTGMDAAELRDNLALDEDDFAAVLTRMFDSKAEEVRTRPTEHVYVQYILDQGKNIADLTDMIGEFKSTRQHSAMVSAIKARSDIQDKIIERGQQFGLIAKSPEQGGQLVAGIVIAELTNDELRKAVYREMKAINDMMASSSDVNFIDVEVTDIHRGPALPPEAMGELKPAEPEPVPIKPKRKKKKQRIRVGGSRSR